MRTAPGVLVLALGFFAMVSRSAHAQGSEATATALFDEGRRLMTQHRYGEACPKLAESQRLAPSGGTLLNLAECYEHAGLTASAWAAWKDAAARANAAGKTSVEKNALARAAALEPAMPRLTVAVTADSDVPGLEVRRDGVLVGRGEFGTALPVDPGTHVVEARAPKKKAWSGNVDVAPKQTDARVTVALVDDVEAGAVAPEAPPVPAQNAAPAAPSPVGPPVPASGGSTQKTIGLVVGAAGIVGVAVGSVFGLVAKSDNDQALQNCRTSTYCTAKGLSLTSDAKSAATASTIAFAVGGVAVAAGAVIWLTAPRAPSAQTGARVTPLLAASFGGLAVDTTW